MTQLRERNGRETLTWEERLDPIDLGGTRLRFEMPASLRADLRAGLDGIRVRVRVEAEGLADCDSVEPVAA